MHHRAAIIRNRGRVRLTKKGDLYVSEAYEVGKELAAVAGGRKTNVTYMPRVLLINSDFEFGILLRSFLEEQNLSVDVAFDPPEAAVLLAARHYEIVFLGSIPLSFDDAMLADTLKQRESSDNSALVGVASNAAADFVIDRRDLRRQLKPIVASAHELLQRRKQSIVAKLKIA